MELTLESALSADGLVGHTAYLILVFSMLMRRLVLLRILVILSALVAIYYASVILNDPVSTFWESMLVAVNVGQLAVNAWINSATRFEGREAELRERHFPKLSPRRFRRLLAAGEWTTLESASELTRQGVPVPSLYYLAGGSAAVHIDGVRIGSCTAGTFVGEMTANTGEPAFATVVADGDCDVWQIKASVLRQLTERQPEIGIALEAAIFRTIRLRLIERNQRDVLEQMA